MVYTAAPSPEAAQTIWDNIYNNIDKTLNPFDRVVRTILLTSTTINSIRLRRSGGTGTGGAAAAVPIIPVGGG